MATQSGFGWPQDTQDEALAKHHIREVLARYARAIDRADGALLKTCYHPDAIEEHGGNFAGNAYDYIDQAIPKVMKMGPMQHLLGNSHMRLAGWAEQRIQDDRRAHEGQEAAGALERDQEKTDPDAGLAKIVGVARVAPETAIHDLAVVGRIRAEIRELQVADGLEDHPDAPEARAAPGEPSDGRRRVGRHRAHEHERRQPHEESLQQVDVQ